LLFIDVNLGNGTKPRIALYEGDSPTKVAAEFCMKNKLDNTMKAKLVEMLEDQLSKVLTKIDESSEGELNVGSQ
jgi:hypothetical protein